MSKLDRIASKMREAFSVHDTGEKPIPWTKAAPEKREAWRVCARAAVDVMSAA